MQPVLSMRNITKVFFGKAANDGISLDFYGGEVQVLLGENGAGKTTLMNILYGIYTPDEGDILFEGKKARLKAPKDAIALGIGMVHQHFTLVPCLTAADNITLGLKDAGAFFPDRKGTDARLTELSRKYGLALEPRKKVSEMSVGEQQRVEIMKLLYRDARVLILDEPTAVLTPQETEDLFRVLEKLKRDGKCIIIITHRIPEVMRIADRVSVLRDGKCAARFERDELDESELSRAMIGRTLSVQEVRGAGDAREEGLRLENVTAAHRGKNEPDGLSLTVRAGEIHGIAGVDGNGQKQLAELIMGIRRASHGRITLFGEDLTGLNVSERKSRGIGYISDDRHRDGLLLNMSLADNLLLTSERSDLVKRGFLKRRGIQAAAKKAVEEFDIRVNSVDLPIRYLSGGNQQKLILARELHDGVRLIVAFQPTRGLDIGASEAIREKLLAYRDRGCCVLLISADLDEIFSVSDRVSVMHAGAITGTMVNDCNIDLTRIGLMMAGRAPSVAGETADDMPVIGRVGVPA